MSAHLHILGRLGRDAEIRYTADQTAICNLAIAYNYGRKDQSGNQPSQWVEASLFGKRAESLAQYLTKGTQVNVLLESPHVETFDKRDGTQGVKFVGRVLDIALCGGGERRHDAKPTPKPAKEEDDYFSDDVPF